MGKEALFLGVEMAILIGTLTGVLWFVVVISLALVAATWIASERANQ